jgi:hypothetical protein
LADRLVALEIVPAISHETVRQTLKKTPSSRGGCGAGCSRQRRMPRLSPPWRMCWPSMRGRSIQPDPWSVSTRPARS